MSLCSSCHLKFQISLLPSPVPDTVRSQPAATASHSDCLTHRHTLCVCLSYLCVTNDEHPGHANFECQSGQCLSWLRFSMVFHSTTRCFKLDHDIEALCHKSEDHRFDSWWGHGFFIALILLAVLWPLGHIIL